MSLSATLHLISILVRAVLSPPVPLKGKHHSDSHKHTHIYTYGVKLSSCSFLTRFENRMGNGKGSLWGSMEKWDKSLQCENRCRGFRVVSSELAWKGRINIWVRCIKQRFNVGVSTLQRGFQFQWLRGCVHRQKLNLCRHSCCWEVNISKCATPWM